MRSAIIPAMKSYADIRGDGGSDVLGQVVAQQAAVRAALAGVRHRVAIGSGKGGVGKSTVTMALAQAFLARGRRVAILDADLNGPCQAQMAGLTGTPWIPGETGMVLPRRADGLGVVSMGSLLEAARPLTFASVAHGEEQTWRGTREMATLTQLLAGVEWGELDLLLFDLPPGAERTRQFADLLGEGTRFVLVTIPSDLSHGVVARAVTAVEGSAARLLGYVENMAGYACRGCGEVRPLFPVAATRQPLAVPCLGELPFDPDLALLCDRGWPAGGTHADLPALRAAAVVAERLETILESLR